MLQYGPWESLHLVAGMDGLLFDTADTSNVFMIYKLYETLGFEVTDNVLCIPRP